MLKKRLPLGDDKLHVLSHEAAMLALAAAAELAGELLAGVDVADRQDAFDLVMQTIVISHESARGNGPSIDGTKVIANGWLV